MKRLLYLTLTVLTVLATASCEKGGNKAKSPGAFSLKTEIAVFDKSFPLRYAWFFYSEPKDGYNIVFSDQPDFSALSESNYFAIDIPKSSCGTKMDVTTGLSSADWYCVIYYGSVNKRSYSDSELTEGTMLVDVTDDGEIIMEVDVKTPEGLQIQASFKGQGKAEEGYIFTGFDNQAFYYLDSEFTGFYPIYAWYYYDKEKGGYDILLMDQPDLSKRAESNSFVIDLHESFCGKSNDMTTSLKYTSPEGDTWNFYFFVCDRIFSNGSFSGGSVWLEVDRDKNFITLEMMGDNIHNTHFDIFYKGPAIRSEEYLSDYIWD